VFSKIGSFAAGLYQRVMPGFWLRLRPQYQASLGLLLLICLWLATGLFRIGAHAAAALDKDAADVPLVRVAEMAASLHDATVTMRGQTSSLNQVDLRAEVEGVVLALRAGKGERVKKGAVICEIKLNDRGAKMAQAEAQVAQSQKELEVARELYKEGFRSKTQMAQAEATFEASRAGAAAARIQLDNTRIRAPFDGVVDERYVNPGDYMSVGGKCAMLIAPEPFLAVGTVSEEEVGQIAAGNRAVVKLVTGETVEGTVRFVANHSEQTTRAFRVEVELPNKDGKLRSGVSADIRIPVGKVPAHHISPGILVLDDSGVVGVRIVDHGVAKFAPVRVLSDGPDGMWVAGLPGRVSVITVGQEFVVGGEKVKAVPANPKPAKKPGKAS
jgi:membrane fusion protein, multidrug efflux system